MNDKENTERMRDALLSIKQDCDHLLATLGKTVAGRLIAKRHQLIAEIGLGIRGVDNGTKS